jgi:transcriptional regulator with XRE-family HTH domain
MPQQDIQDTVFSERLSALMKSGQVTQVMLAEGIGAGQPTISRYLAGQLPKAEELLKLARFFDVPMEVVLGTDAIALNGEKSERRSGKESARASASQPILINFEIRALRQAASKLRKAAATLQANADDLERQADKLATSSSRKTTPRRRRTA